ncbi:MAG: hypothetical protein M3285_05115 [Actinomycetota bacterium]|nr:hypothetical protein [Actinomycetota bacterium]
MSKRFLTVSMAAAMVLSGLSAFPAQAATAVPEVVQVTDPVGDANFINNQDRAEPQLNDVRDVTAPACPPFGAPCDGGTVSDLMKVWFTNTADTVSMHMQTERPPPATTTIYYRIASNPETAGAPTGGCLHWRMIFGGKQANPAGGAPIATSTYRSADLTSGADHAEFEDTCNGGGRQAAESVTVETLEDGTGITTMTVNRSASPLLGEGAKIVSPYAVSRLAAGVKGQNIPVQGGSFVGSGQSDSTRRGTDFELLAGDDPPPPPPPPVCKKAQKKTCECPAFVPAEVGADAELTKITEKATAKRPAIVTVSSDPGAGVGGVPVVESGIAHAFENLQVDLKKKKTTGLYVRLEFPDQADYDLTLFNPNGTVAAQSAGFNPAPGHVDPDPVGGHTETGSENIDGIKTAECGGYTADIGTATGIGGDLTMKVWLGKVQYEQPVPADGEGGRGKVRADRKSNGWVKASRYF